MKIEEKKYKKISYVVYYPNANADGKVRVILQLHGTGARGNDLQKVRNIKIYEFAQQYAETFPFIVVSPQCYADSWFDIYEQLQEFVDFIKNEMRADEYYLAGYSMGAYTGWQLLQTKPNAFKKAVLCCGGGAYWSLGRIKTEVIAFHGNKDKRVPISEMQKMVDLVNEHGGIATLTVFDGVEHNCWDRVYTDKNTYERLLD